MLLADPRELCSRAGSIAGSFFIVFYFFFGSSLLSEKDVGVRKGTELDSAQIGTGIVPGTRSQFAPALRQ